MASCIVHSRPFTVPEEKETTLILHLCIVKRKLLDSGLECVKSNTWLTSSHKDIIPLLMRVGISARITAQRFSRFCLSQPRNSYSESDTMVVIYRGSSGTSFTMRYRYGGVAQANVIDSYVWLSLQILPMWSSQYLPHCPPLLRQQPQPPEPLRLGMCLLVQQVCAITSLFVSQNRT